MEEAVYLFDKNKELLTSISPENTVENMQELQLNDLIIHTVRGVYTDKVEEAHFFGVVDVDDSNIFWMYKVDKQTTENDYFVLHGTYVLFDDLRGRGGVMRDRRPQGESIIQILPDILEGTGWSIGNIQSSNIGTSNYYYVSKLEAFWDFLDQWNVEFYPRMVYSQGEIVGKYIDIYDQLSDDYGKWYEYGDRLLTVTKEQSSSNIYTAFIGRGRGEEVSSPEANPSGQAGYGRSIRFTDVEWSIDDGDPVDKPLGQDWVEIPQATAQYGYEDGSPRFTIVEFSDIEDEELLLEATYNHAVEESRPKVQFKSTVIENGLAELGEIATIIRDEINIRYKTRIFHLKRDFKAKEVKEVDFGDELVQSTAKRNRDTFNAIKQVEKETSYWLDDLRGQIVDSYFNDDGYNYDLRAGNEYGLPGGYYSFDAPIDENPSKVIYLGAGRLLIANSKLPNGNWDFRTAATGDGFVADVINTGTLNSDLVQVGFNNINSWLRLTSDALTIDSNEYTDMRLDRSGMNFNENDTRFPIGGISVLHEPGDPSNLRGLWLYTNHGYDTSISYESESDPNVYNSAIRVDGTTGETNMYGRFHLENQMDIHGDIRFMQEGYHRGTIQQDGETDDINLRYSSRFKVIRNRDNLIKLSISWDKTFSYNEWHFNHWDLNDIGTLRQINRIDNVGSMNDIGQINTDSLRVINGGHVLTATGGGNVGLVANGSTWLGQGTPNSFYQRLMVRENVDLYTDLSMRGNTILNQSDIRLKEDIEPIDFSPMDLIDKSGDLKYFRWKKDHVANKSKSEERQIGLMAQENPYFTRNESDHSHYESIDESKRLNFLYGAVKELITENKQLKADVEELKQNK